MVSYQKVPSIGEALNPQTLCWTIALVFPFCPFIESLPLKFPFYFTEKSLNTFSPPHQNPKSPHFDPRFLLLTYLNQPSLVHKAPKNSLNTISNRKTTNNHQKQQIRNLQWHPMPISMPTSKLCISKFWSKLHKTSTCNKACPCQPANAPFLPVLPHTQLCHFLPPILHFFHPYFI